MSSFDTRTNTRLPGMALKYQTVHVEVGSLKWHAGASGGEWGIKEGGLAYSSESDLNDGCTIYREKKSNKQKLARQYLQFL